MNFKRYFNPLFLLVVLFITVSCDKDSEENKDVYTVPATYVFKDAAAASTVSFSGQTERLEMLSEIVTYLKSANAKDVTLSADQLKKMYANSEFTWTDANSLGLTGSSKQLKSKTAGGDAGVQAIFESYFDAIANISGSGFENTAQEYGKSGVWTNGSKSYLMSEEGFEYTQLIEKGLMSAVFVNQMTGNYLKNIAADDNTTLEEGKNYTAMQHHWDEAYGYFTSAVDYPTSGTDKFWGKYAYGVEETLGSATKIATAFRTGRAAIDNKDYATRDAQVVIINQEIEKVCAASAIHYLNEAKSATDATVRNHVLSEAKAFVDGLRYGQRSISGEGISAAKIDEALALFATDFENATVTKLNSAIAIVAEGTGLTALKETL